MAALLFLAALACVSVRLAGPPAAVAEDAPAEVFSSGRAMRHLREIARAPHPTGTDEHARAREYLVAQLAALGLSPEVQTAEVVTRQHWSTPAAAGRVSNIVARLPGAARGGRALMLAAHYDSVPTAPGASDDGAGVVALLETLRALRQGGPLKNDLILLFTDGEELGLLGAHAFAETHPWMREVGVVLNFEGRGAGGPSMMFETSEGNGRLVRSLADTAPHPVANSLMYAVYKRLPNDTDMTVFKAAGAEGLNFAYASRLTHYHTMLDGAEEMDERSLQHHGSYALALARRLGDEDLSAPREADAVYFNAVGPVFIRYPESWVFPFTLLVVVLFAVVVFVGLRRRRLSLRGTAAGLLAPLVAAVCAGLLTTGVWRAARALHAGYEFLPWRTPYNLWLYVLGFLLLTVAVVWYVYAFLFRGTSPLDLFAGALAAWLLLLLLTTVALPAGSFLYAWPLLFALPGLGLLVSTREGDAHSAKTSLIVALSAVPCVALVAPLVYMFFMMLGLELTGLFVALPVLALGLLAPLLRAAGGDRRWALPSAMAVGGVALVVAALLTAGFDAQRKKANSVFYFLDADEGRALWVSADAAPDEWTSQFLGRESKRRGLSHIFPWMTARLGWEAEAPALALPAPLVEVLEDEQGDDARTVRLRVASARGAPMLFVYTDPVTRLRRAEINGKPVVYKDVNSGKPPALESASGGARSDGKFSLRVAYAAPPAEGVELVLETEPTSPLRLTAQDITYGLPEVPGRTFAPRPEHMMPAPSNRASNTTLVRRTINLEAKQ